MSHKPLEQDSFAVQLDDGHVCTILRGKHDAKQRRGEVLGIPERDADPEGEYAAIYAFEDPAWGNCEVAVLHPDDFDEFARRAGVAREGPS